MARFRQAAGLLGFGVILTELLIALVSAEGTAPPLGAYNADIRESSISGSRSAPSWPCSRDVVVIHH